ncbi:MAG TPA: pyridoxine 5'-phosphate synthase, partial [Cytophagaceae bacterium]|nr:pyridoxine 5'-phosphate synthase [Cytophagaceae bacterium]
MTRLSVNINKIATLRNARGGNNPDVVKTALDCERFGAEGITVHPRPDERHIRYDDARELKKVLKTEFNIEGNPDKKFIDLVLEVKPGQVTLVPDEPGAITSNQGWNTVKHLNFLKEITKEFQKNNIRVSLFVDPVVSMVEGAANAGADRVELYTEPYATNFHKNKEQAIAD